MTNDFVKVDQWGQCLWGIDENGVLFLNEGEAASIDGVAPWADYIYCGSTENSRGIYSKGTNEWNRA